MKNRVAPKKTHSRHTVFVLLRHTNESTPDPIWPYSISSGVSPKHHLVLDSIELHEDPIGPQPSILRANLRAPQTSSPHRQKTHFQLRPEPDTKKKRDTVKQGVGLRMFKVQVEM